MVMCPALCEWRFFFFSFRVFHQRYITISPGVFFFGIVSAGPFSHENSLLLSGVYKFLPEELRKIIISSVLISAWLFVKQCVSSKIINVSLQKIFFSIVLFWDFRIVLC